MSEMYAEKLLRDLWRLKVKKAEATGPAFEQLCQEESDKWLEICSYLSARASGQEGATPNTGTDEPATR